MTQRISARTARLCIDLIDACDSFQDQADTLALYQQDFLHDVNQTVDTLRSNLRHLVRRFTNQEPDDSSAAGLAS